MNADQEAVASVARRHGIALIGEIEISDLGLDFRIAFGSDQDGGEWVLRFPRRPDVLPRAENEARVLGLLKSLPGCRRCRFSMLSLPSRPAPGSTSRQREPSSVALDRMPLD